VAAGFGSKAHIGLSVRTAIAHTPTWSLLFVIDRGDVHLRAVWLALRVGPGRANDKPKSITDSK
jgi:hypothetical protein